MKRKLIILSILSLSLTAQACGGGSGPKGVWKSSDAGRTWEQKNLVLREGRKKPDDILNSVDVRDISAAPDNDDVIYAATSQGVFASDNAGEVWHHVLPDSDIQTVVVANADTNFVYAVGNVGDRGVIYKSSDKGVSWERKYTEAAENLGWSLAVNPADANDIYAGFNSGLLLRSRNGGETWGVVNTFPSRVQELRYHPRDSRIVFALIRNNGLMVTRDSGNSFVSITTSLTSRSNNLDILVFQQRGPAAPTGFIDFDFSQAEPEIIYLTTDTGLFRTKDTGLAWSDLKLPVDPAHAQTIAIKVAKSSEHIYVSIDTVLYRSTDGGQTFNTQRLPTSRLIRTIHSSSQNPEIVYVGMIGN